MLLDLTLPDSGIDPDVVADAMLALKEDDLDIRIPSPNGESLDLHIPKRDWYLQAGATLLQSLIFGALGDPNRWVIAINTYWMILWTDALMQLPDEDRPDVDESTMQPREPLEISAEDMQAYLKSLDEYGNN